MSYSQVVNWRHVVVFPDGNAICAIWSKNPDFINIQESPCGFGETNKEAVEGLLKSSPMRCRQPMWTGYGAPCGCCGDSAYSNQIHNNTKDMACEPEVARCPRHGGFDIGASAALISMYACEERDNARTPPG